MRHCSQRVIAHGRELADGREGFISAVRQLHETFDEARIEVEEDIAAGDVVVQALTFKGRHTGGDYLGIAPSGNDVAVHQIWILRTDGHHIRAIREEWDALGLIRQLRRALDHLTPARLPASTAGGRPVDT